MANKPPRRMVLGVGNPGRGDDAAGRAVVRRLEGLLPAGVEVIERDGEATALLAEINGAAAAFIVDACASGAPPGTIRRFDASTAPLPDLAFALSTHGFGLAAAIELARALGQLPPRCVVYAIEGDTFEAGAPLSPAVAKAVVEVARRLRAEIAEDGNHA
jgi:hydrogenase maturation protease